MDRIDTLAELIRDLAAKDTRFEVFGANTFGSGHRYKMNRPIRLNDVQTFEREYAVGLPEDYRNFLLRIGNGGAGPYYGLYSLDQSVKDAPHHQSRAFLGTPFPLTEKFNPYSETANDDEMFDDKHICGSIVLAHQGCGYYDRLVINGPQRGQVWTDGRVSDQGLVPLHCDFYEWYHRWLIDSLASLRHP